MAGKVITVAQQKGGSGKTTVAAHLALAWSAGRVVTLIDLDPQASLTHWYQLRLASLGNDDPGIVVEFVPGWRVTSEIERLKRATDLLVIDSPAHADFDARSVIRAADLVVIPIQPSPLDLWAAKPTIDLAAVERRPAILLLNRVPPRSSIAEEMTGDAAKLGIEVMESRIGNRTSFAASMATGRTVGETAASSLAAKEVAAAAAEILGRLGQ